jgi:hypothetical protein
MLISPELSSFLQDYLEESLKLENNILILPFTVWGKLNNPNENLIVKVVRHENKWKNKLKLLVYNQDKKYQQTKIQELKLLVSEIEKAEERFFFKGDVMKSASFFISFLSVFLTVLAKFMMGDNNIAIQVVVLSILYLLSLCIFANAWYYQRLSSNTKCLGKTAKEVLDCFSTNNSIFNDL